MELEKWVAMETNDASVVAIAASIIIRILQDERPPVFDDQVAAVSTVAAAAAAAASTRADAVQCHLLDYLSRLLVEVSCYLSSLKKNNY